MPSTYTGNIILDQDPSAVALVYSAQFRAGGQLADEQYTRHLEALIDLEERLGAIASRRVLVLLDAPLDVLEDRMSRKWPSHRISREWLSGIRERFHPSLCHASQCCGV